MAKRTLALLLGLAAAVLLLELALRLASAVAPDRSPPHLRPLPPSGPVVSTWPATTGEDQAPRIVIIGDSFTLGRGVKADQVYPARLAASLADGGYVAQVVSYSWPGWNTRAEARSLTADIDRLDPDLLIVGHCLNDPEKRPTRWATANRPELRPWRPRGSVERFLDAHSRLFGRVRRAVDTLRLRPILRSYYAGLYQNRWGRQLWRRSLRSIERLAAERSIPALLVVFPIFDSNPDSDYPYRELHADVSRTAEDLGYRALDLLPAYEGMDGHDLALVPYTDPHPSALAHEVAGREIARFLEDRELVSRR